MSTICSTGCRGTTSATSVGACTNCSAICVSTTAARRGRDGHKILGTSITCSVIAASAHHLRLKYIDSLYHGSEAGKLLHGVPLYLLLRPRLSERLGPLSRRALPHTAGRDGGGLPDLGRVVRLVHRPHRSWPASVPVGRCGGLTRLLFVVCCWLLVVGCWLSLKG